MLVMLIAYGPQPGVKATWDGERWQCGDRDLRNMLNTHAGLDLVHPDDPDSQDIVKKAVMDLWTHSTVISQTPVPAWPGDVVF